LVLSTSERRDFWRQLKSLAGIDEVIDVEAIANQAKAEMASKLTHSLLALASGGDLSALSDFAATPAAAAAGGGNGSAAAADDYEPVWIETPECTACDECTNLAPKVFEYNADKQATVINPKGAPYSVLVKAAEKCTAGCIHPGTPWDPNEKGLDKLRKRAEKFQ
jgi:pyruvate-ferredoxin/flavodoxin oxidoreductase